MAELHTVHELENHHECFPRLGTIQEYETPPAYPASHKERPPLDITQRIERRLARLNASENIIKRWLLELICWIISAICMSAIIGILSYLKDKALSKWPIGLALVTILAKVAAATLIIPTSEAIGQLKWNWFIGGTSKEIVDFEIFDKASRGPWGSIMLILRTKGKSLAVLGAILTLLMLAIDTFFQQVYDLPERWILQGEAFVPRVIRYQPHQTPLYRNSSKQAQDDQDLLTLTQKFFYDNGTQPITSGNGTRPDIPVSCPTSNCTWPLYQTLGFCSACEDVTNLLTYTCVSATIDWTPDLMGAYFESTYPNGTMCGYFINSTSSNPILMSGYISDTNVSSNGQALVTRLLPLVTIPYKETLFGGSINYKDIRNPVLDVIVVSAVNGPESVYRNETPIAKECILSWCVRTISSSYYWGGYKEEVIDTFTNTTPGAYPWLTTPYLTAAQNGTDAYYMENITIDVPMEQNSTIYGVSNATMMGTVFAIDKTVPAYVTVANVSAGQILRYGQYQKYPWSRALKVNPWLPPNNIAHYMERLATAMTNVIRSDLDSSEFVSGHAYGKEVYVNVVWGWLAFPISLLILSLLFLIATVAKTSREKSDVGVWKTSAMPSLIYSLPQTLQESLTSKGPTWTTSGRAGAKKTKIKLLPDKGWRVSGYSSAPTTPITRRQAPPGWI